jgi:hypothetical protein
VTAIQSYCVENSESINQRTMNTDTVEWHFGNSRQMAPCSSNRLTAAGWDNAARKASAFNASKMVLVGNNSSGKTHLVGIRYFNDYHQSLLFPML